MISKSIFENIINKKDFRSSDLDMSQIEMRATREGFGDALLKLGELRSDVVALCADLTESVQMHKFRTAYPERFFQMGIAEQNMASVASGMSAMGKLPVIASYAAFNPGRNWEQIRTTICYNDRKVIIVGAHSGLSVGPDGGTHQALEDLALMRALPNITIFSPSDYVEAYNMTLLASEIEGPVYVRLAREKSPVLYDKSHVTNLSKPDMLYASHLDSPYKVGVIATGPVIFEALLAARDLESENIAVTILNLSQIKPVDEDMIITFAKNNKNRIITLEEHQRVGGLGGLIAEILSAHSPSHVTRIGVDNRYGQSGTTSELYAEYGLDRESIKSHIREMIHKN